VRQLLRGIYRSLPLRRQLFDVVRGRLALPRAIYQHLYFEGPFEVAIDEAHRFQMVGYGNALENEIYWGGFGGTWEQMSLKVWVRLCTGADNLIIDVGANTGIYSLAAAAVAPKAKVVAFEPISRIADRLRINAQLNSFDIEIVEKAVSDQSGMLSIFDTTDGFNYSASLEQPLANTVSYPVEVTTIDDFVLGAKGRASVQAVKIDVETHEPAVVRGMRDVLERKRPAILIEILNERIGAEISRMISPFGYRWFHIDEKRGLAETDQLNPIGGRNWNHLLCPPDMFAAAGLEDLLALRNQ